jgi:hypothetical protein
MFGLLQERAIDLEEQWRCGLVGRHRSDPVRVIGRHIRATETMIKLGCEQLRILPVTLSADQRFPLSAQR